YAMVNKIPFALVQNKDGNFVKASGNSVSAAGNSALASGATDLTLPIWNQSGKDAYPISTFSYIILYKDLAYLKDPAKAKALVEFLSWATTGGEELTGPIGYAPLSPDVQKKVGDVLNSLTFDGKPVK